MAEIGGEMAEIGGQMAEISGITFFAPKTIPFFEMETCSKCLFSKSALHQKCSVCFRGPVPRLNF